MAIKGKKGDVSQVIGVTGLRIWGGVLGEEYLAVLKGTRKVKVFREMQDDAVIGCLLDAIIMPLMAAEFETVPAGDAEKDKQNAEFLWQCMNDMTKYSWRQHVLDMLGMLAWGWAASEMVFKKRLGQDSDRPSQYNDGKLGFHILDPRGQETLDKWKMDDEFNVELMVQKDPNSSQLIEIESWKLLHATFRSRKRSPEGLSPLRSLYREWYTRKNLEVIEAIGAERDLCGLPVFRLPYGASDADKVAAELLIRNLRQDEEAGLVLPPPPSPDANVSKWEFELISSPGQKQFNVREIIRDLNKVILMRFFAQFLLLGMEKVGTQALVEGSQDFFSLALTSVQQELLETWNQQLVPLLFAMNPQMLSGASGMPTIDWAGPGSKDVQRVVTMAKDMVAAQLLTPEEKLEDYLRTITGLPDRPEGIGQGPRSPVAPPMPGLLSYEWYELPDGSWLARPKKEKIQLHAQPDVGDVHIPTAIKRKRRDHCMLCEEPPIVEVLWAEGMARAWFCAACYKEWKAESETHEVVEERKVEGGTVPQRWAGYEQEVDEVASFVDVAGIKGRRGSSKIGKATNEYQGLLTNIYDRWAKTAQKAILVADEAGAKGKELTKVIDKQLLALAKGLKAAAQKHIGEAFRLGMKGQLDRQAEKLLEKQVEQNSKFVDESLIPRIREKIVAHLDELKEKHQYQLDAVGLLGLLVSMRSEPVGFAGAFWSGIFIGAGLNRQREDKKRIEEGMKPRRVRWVLDPAAEHCQKSAHGHGCPDLAGEYESWEDMPTVPAGSVTCLGNCRCRIMIENDSGEWEYAA